MSDVRYALLRSAYSFSLNFVSAGQSIDAGTALELTSRTDRKKSSRRRRFPSQLFYYFVFRLCPVVHVVFDLIVRPQFVAGFVFQYGGILAICSNIGDGLVLHGDFHWRRAGRGKSPKSRPVSRHMSGKGKFLVVPSLPVFLFWPTGII